MTLGEQIRGARETKNLSQEALAETLGVSRQAVSKWENGTAMPQGANRAALIEILELDMTSETPAPQKRDILRWLGWLVAALLLLTLVIMIVFWSVSGPGGVGSAPDAPEPSTTPVEIIPPAETGASQVTAIRFYDSEQNEVLAPTLWYNTAKIDSILIQWTGEAPLEYVETYFTPQGTETKEQTELLKTKYISSDSGAVLLSAEPLHREGLMGHLWFELHFVWGRTAKSGSNINVVYDPTFSVP